MGNSNLVRGPFALYCRTTISVAEELEFKYYDSLDFTTSYDEQENIIYARDESGNVIWVKDEATGTSRKVVLRVLRPLEASEAVSWTWVLVGLPLAGLACACAVVTLRRKNR